MKDLVKNPIGIIALFISMIYGFANLLLGTTANSLTPEERYPLVVFIVLFPVLVLGIYYLLVSRHHGKLYAPGDYKEDNSFLRTLSPEERKIKLEKETQEAFIDSVNQEVAVEKEPEAGSGDDAGVFAAESGAIKRAATASPVSESAPSSAEPIPPAESTIRASAEANSARGQMSGGLSRGKSIGVQRFPVHQNLAEARREMQLIENLTILKFESEFGQSSGRDVGVGPTGAAFDAFFSQGSKLTFVEVKTLRSPEAVPLSIERLFYNAIIAENYLPGNFKLIIAFVYYFDKEQLPQVEEKWQKKVDQCPANIELRFFHRSDLDD